MECVVTVLTADEMSFCDDLVQAGVPESCILNLLNIYGSIQQIKTMICEMGHAIVNAINGAVDIIANNLQKIEDECRYYGPEPVPDIIPEKFKIRASVGFKPWKMMVHPRFKNRPRA